MLSLPLSPESWVAIFSTGIILAGLGWEYRQRPVFDEPTHWTNGLAYATMVVGRIIVFGAVCLFFAGAVDGFPPFPKP